MVTGFSTFSELDRRALYGDAIINGHAPGRVNKGLHTMGHAALLRYIGFEGYSGDMNNFVLNTKKFSPEQSRLILLAFNNNLVIRVVGAYRRDIDFIVERNKRKIVTDSISENTRRTAFNRLRPSLFLTEPDGVAGEKELWVVVFPSTQYVEQYSELILAVMIELSVYHRTAEGGDVPLDEISRIKIETDVRSKISVTHFKALAQNIGRWTNLLPFATQHVRLGEVVAIGNVDAFEVGLRNFSFEPKTEAWLSGGLDDIFGLKTLVNPFNRARIVLLGVAECFWGDASAQYVKSLMESGARHVLYGSKAATLVSHTFVRKVVAPTAFVTVTRGLGPNGELPEENQLTEQIAMPNLLKSMTDAFEIAYGGIGVTVPTVMGEDQHEYSAFNMIRPACMDCENGHIASTVNSFNKRDDNLPICLHSNIARDVKFVPVHFVTDYIYEQHQIPTEHTPNLAIDRNDEHHIMHKLRAYNKIGQYFGSYSNVFGLQHDFDVPREIDRSLYDDEEYADELDKNRQLVDSGNSRDAVTALLSSGSRHHMSANHAAAIAVVCQKYGFVSPAYQALGLAERAASKDGDGERLQARCGVVRLKLLMQMGAFDDAKMLAEGWLQRPDLLKSVGVFGAVCRRMAILVARAGNYQEAQTLIQAARGDDTGLSPDTNVATCELFDKMSLYASGGIETREMLESQTEALSEIRRMYFETGKDGVAGEAQGQPATYDRIGGRPNIRLVRGAVAALFLEAAASLALSQRRNSYRARMLIATAHVLGRRLGINECAETFGEIANLTKNSQVRDLLKLSLRQDNIGRRTFVEWCDWADVDVSQLAESCMMLLHASNDRKADMLTKIVGGEIE